MNNDDELSAEIILESAIAAFPMSTAFELDALPLSYVHNILTVGMTVDGDHEAIEKIRFASRIQNVEIKIMPIQEIRNGLQKAYPKSVEEGNNDDVRNIAQKIFEEAARRHAQDIFIEPASQAIKTGQVRLAIDGRLEWSERYRRLSPDIFLRLLGYIYNQSECQPQNRNLPGDGRLIREAEGREINLRVAYIPMDDLACINMRVLSSSLVLRDIQSLGMTKVDYKTFSTAMRRPGAFITIAGPTGEGKSTTAYSAIKELDLDYQNICSIENPVECDIDGVKQINISAESGRSSENGQMTFNDAARSLMRMYPQFVFLGEIRDRETLEIATLMSTTGISLICTTHAHNALKAILRFEALGATRQQITQAMTMSMSQRLLGKLCMKCRVKNPGVSGPTKKIAALYGITYNPENLYRANPKGCERCKGRGYDDRVGSFEILDFTPEIIEALVQNKSLTEIGYIAIENGFRPMIVSALEHMFNGDTDEMMIRKKLSYNEAINYVKPGTTPPGGNHYDITEYDEKSEE